MSPCPCGSGRDLEACCGPIMRGEQQAGTAEALMRSRFTAFSLGDEGHLLRSWHPDTRPPTITFVAGQRWLSLDVLATEGGGFLDATGTVEFTAHHERDGRKGALHERSRFERHDGRWTYLGPERADVI